MLLKQGEQILPWHFSLLPCLLLACAKTILKDLFKIYRIYTKPCYFI